MFRLRPGRDVHQRRGVGERDAAVVVFDDFKHLHEFTRPFPSMRARCDGYFRPSSPEGVVRVHLRDGPSRRGVDAQDVAHDVLDGVPAELGERGAGDHVELREPHRVV